jgi:hypothetical protein
LAHRLERTLSAPPLLIVLLFLLAPFYWMLITSLKPNSELYNAGSNPMLVFAPSLEHYVHLLTETEFPSWTKNTLLISIVSTALSLLFGVPAATRSRGCASRRPASLGWPCLRPTGAHVAAVHPDAPGGQDAPFAGQRVVAGADLSNVSDAVLYLVDGWLLQDDSE